MNRTITAGLATLFLMTAVNVAARADDASPGWQGAKTIGDGFGVQVKEWHTPPEALDDIKSAGFGYLRYGILWSMVETTPGNYDWSKFDKFINDTLSRNFSSIIMLDYGNPAYSGKIKAPGDNADHLAELNLPPTKAEAVAAYAKFAAAAAERYKDKRITFELGNEPDFDRFWAPKVDAKAYAVMASAACKAMRDAVPDVKVIGPAAAGMPGWHDRARVGFIETLLRSPAGACLDAISVHSYRLTRGQPDKNPESVMDDNASAISFISDHTPSGQKVLPLLCSEWGYTTAKVSPEQQANYIVRMQLANLLSGVPLTVNYEWRDSHKEKNEGGKQDVEAHFGMQDFDGNPKLAYTTVKGLLPKIRDAVIEKRLDTGDTQNFALQIRQPDGSLNLLYWTAHEPVVKGAALKIDGGKTYPLTATPQLAPLSASTPKLTLVTQKASP